MTLAIPTTLRVHAFWLIVVISCLSGVQAEDTRLTEITQGSLLLKSEQPGVYQRLPMLDTQANITVTGPIARTQLVQRFKNPGEAWQEAIYAFPLPENAAVDRLRMQVGDAVIEGKIMQKQAARQVYDRARQAGKRTALVEQRRPNLFTTGVANIPPGGEITVHIEYQQRLHWAGQKFSLRFPMAITPRYTPPSHRPATQVIESRQNLTGGWAILPNELPNVLKAAGGSSDVGEPFHRVSLSVHLDAGFPLAAVNSLYHAVSKTDLDGAIRIQLSDESVVAERDFVLEWMPARTDQPSAAFFKQHTEQGEYGLLMLMPPTVALQQRPEREVTFIIDTSGSMAGESIRQARKALLHGLDGLAASDHFNIVEFNSGAKILFDRPQPARGSSLQRAKRYVGGLKAGGGTEIMGALKTALQGQEHNPKALQQLVFITDGSVGNEAEIFEYIHQRLQQRRLFMVGIGSAPNSHFMTEAAHFGRGSFTYIAKPEEVQGKMQSLFARLENPVLTHLSVSVEGASDLLPDPVPDVYHGEPVVVAMKLNAPLQTVQLNGRLGLTEWNQTLQLSNGMAQSGLRVDWAREKIKQWSRAGIRGASADEVRAEVTRLALLHHLVSPYTSLVAVDVTPVRPVDKPLDSHAIKGERPAGMAASQGGQVITMARGATDSQLLILMGVLMLLAAALVYLRNKSSRAVGRESM